MSITRVAIKAAGKEIAACLTVLPSNDMTGLMQIVRHMTKRANGLFPANCEIFSGPAVYADLVGKSLKKLHSGGGGDCPKYWRIKAENEIAGVSGV